MIHPDTYVKKTDRGLGLFAKRRFERGTILWIADDVDARIPLRDYLSLDDLLRHKLDNYSYLDYKGRVVLNWDEAKFVNHSCAPNIAGIEESDNVCLAVCAIEADEEIVEDYCHFYGHFKTFSCTCGAPNCRGTISETVNSYESTLRLHFTDICQQVLSQPQALLNAKSSESADFFRLLQTSVPVCT